MVNDIPYSFHKTSDIHQVIDQWSFLSATQESGHKVKVAGRVVLSRPQGGLSFASLRDWTGSIQLFALKSVTLNFDQFSKLKLGDWVGVEGEVIRTKRGELSVKVESWVLLADAILGFGDKYKGIKDSELRMRHREADLWANERSLELLLLRSRLISFLRRYLENKGYIEVETPILHPVPSGALARPFVTHHNALDMDLYLRVAPELYLKRLVVGGLEKVFEIGRAFRNEGLSPRHNPEFTIMELYQAYADYNDIMYLTEEIISAAAVEVYGSSIITYQDMQLDLTPPWDRIALTALLSEAVSEDVNLDTPLTDLKKLAKKIGVDVDASWGPGKIVVEMYEKVCEPDLWRPTFVCDYPLEVSPLARQHRSKKGYVERFELIIAGRELANAFSELCDPKEQQRRFVQQSSNLAAGEEEAMGMDLDYVTALEHGLPPTGGLGIGVDRLVMLLGNVTNIKDIIAFPTLRREAPPV
ncbi:MAG: lysine--tRNA ligase [Actinobacteria bacterium]|nr:lysine--tRNA ligase [Actinomycetota bacterium]MCL6104929.1 lysine--tRNA ligase [Actinomycetota bacterium]